MKTSMDNKPKMNEKTLAFLDSLEEIDVAELVQPEEYMKEIGSQLCSLILKNFDTLFQVNIQEEDDDDTDGEYTYNIKLKDEESLLRLGVIHGLADEMVQDDYFFSNDIMKDALYIAHEVTKERFEKS